MIRTQLFIGAALIVGVAIGYMAKPDRAPETDDEIAGNVAALFSDRGDEASFVALRSRIAELEAQLAEKGEGAVQTEQKVGEENPDPRRRAGRRGPPSPAEMRERFAQMEREDPVRFAQMTNHFAQMRQRRIDKAQSRIDFLSSVDATRMGESAKKTHETLQKLIARREEIESQMFDPEIGDEERRAIFREMRETDNALRELSIIERDNLISQMAESIGLTEEESAEVNATISEILDATDFRPQPIDGRR